MRLIDEDEVHKKLTDLYKYAKREARRAYSVAIDIITDADTIEAEPVRHGRSVDMMLGDVVWHKCSEQLPDDDVSKDIFIILKYIPTGVFTAYYAPTEVPSLPFYIHGIGFVESDKILRWAEIPDGFIPKFDVKEIIE